MVLNWKLFHIWLDIWTWKKKFDNLFFSSNFELNFKFLDYFTDFTDASASQISGS